MNIANRLTFVRIIIVPVMWLLLLFPYNSFPINIPVIYFGHVSVSLINIVVLILFVLASITDFLDGYIARKYHLITNLGKFIDPLADKMLVNSLLIVFAYQKSIPLVPVIVMITRDIIVDGCRLIAVNNDVVIPAYFLGKLKTVLQMIVIISILINNLPFELFGIPFKDIIVWFSMLISVLSGYTYFEMIRPYLAEKNSK